jgi:hypothetical protein
MDYSIAAKLFLAVLGGIASAFGVCQFSSMTAQNYEETIELRKETLERANAEPWELFPEEWFNQPSDVEKDLRIGIPPRNSKSFEVFDGNPELGKEIVPIRSAV